MRFVVLRRDNSVVLGQVTMQLLIFLFPAIYMMHN